MTLLSRTELNRLIEPPPGPSVSLYLPTHRLGPEIQQDPIRLKNLLREAERRLLDSGLRSPEAAELLRPAWRLQSDGLFWRHQREGLAIFLSTEIAVHYRLPLGFEELVVVADRFHVKPLLSLLSGDGRFYVLALSQNEARLLEGSRYSVSEVELDELPAGLKEALGSEAPERQLQFHTRAPGSAGGRAAMFHGHGPGGEESKERLLRYFRSLDAALTQHLRDERSPLVLAGVEYYFPIYREANSYPHLVEGGVAGNPEAESIDNLHERAFSLVAPLFERERHQAAARYRELAGTGRTSNRVIETVPAAIDGRVDVLFVAVGVQAWGNRDEASGQILRHDTPEPGDFDLLDLAAVRTLVQGGSVYALAPEDMPDESPLAAILRY
jgi:Bacterial archaeo-eukaryotic release factor family 7